MRLGAEFWDPDAKLIRNPTPPSPEDGAHHHLVRETSWYAVGLLLRDGPGDRAMAGEALNAVLDAQYRTPGVKWYGTYKRSPEEPTPQHDPVMFRDYDPNWREFIGTTFEMILLEYPDRISSALAKAMRAAIQRSIEGEIAEGRLEPSYSNIALMYGALWDFAAKDAERADWQKQSAAWVEATHDVFAKYNAFTEYNSPTYYGVDLYGLALWRQYGSNQHLRALGVGMEAALWKDIAAFYQPGLRNLSGPYDRSYGMDMERYVAVTGVWMRTVLTARKAPLPEITAATDHLGDIWFAPLIAVLGTRVPVGALHELKTTQTGHLVRRQITAERTATAWIGDRVIYGGEATAHTKSTGPGSQFHPVTIQWRTPSGEIGWVRLMLAANVDAVADERGLSLSGTGPMRFRIHAREMRPAEVTRDKWTLPGLQCRISSDADGFTEESNSDGLDVMYANPRHVRIDVIPQ